jgi:hypothetical protein
MTTEESTRLSQAELLAGPVIVTRYVNGRIIATHKRDNETTWRTRISYDNGQPTTANHQAAAEQLLGQWPYDNDLVIIGRGHDADAYYWLVVGRWQLGT